jgi:hypothetical protein
VRYSKENQQATRQRIIEAASTTGGTDVVSAFAGFVPTEPVWAGELSVPCLGVALEAWDPDGRPVVGEVGELVVTEPLPSMPVSPSDVRPRKPPVARHSVTSQHSDARRWSRSQRRAELAEFSACATTDLDECMATG